MGAFTLTRTAACAGTTIAAGHSDQYIRGAVTSAGCVIASGALQEGITVAEKELLHKAAATSLGEAVPGVMVAVKAG